MQAKKAIYGNAYKLLSNYKQKKIMSEIIDKFINDLGFRNKVLEHTINRKDEVKILYLTENDIVRFVQKFGNKLQQKETFSAMIEVFFSL